MKEFIAFVKKEFLHIFRDVRTLLILIGMPVVLIMLFGFAISVEIRNVNVGILAPQHEVLIDRLANKIDASEYFTVAKWLTSDQEIDPLMKQGKVDVVLAFDNRFASRLYTKDGAQLGILVDASNPNIAASEAMYLMGIVQNYFQNNTQQQIKTGGLSTNVRMLYNPQLRSSYNFVPGIMGLILIIICALMTSVSIVREKETGTMEVLLVSPIKPIVIVFAKMIPYFVISCVVLLIIFVLSFTLLHVPMAGSLFWIVIISMLYVILALSIGLFISTIVDSQMVAALITAVVFMLPVLMLSGMLFPLESMPKFFQWISSIVPARWFIAAIRKLMIEGLAVQYVLKELAILAGMTLIILGVALKKFNDRLE
ncbi:MAG: ABC transporter permease [Bacteroidales bacterium]|nr:ABC transporter permease [Bacteroidales bacterium]